MPKEEAIQPPPVKETKEVDKELLAPNQIIVAKGKPYQRIITINPPRGRKNRKKLATHFPLIASLRKLSSEDQFGSMAEVMRELWASDEFEGEVLPLVLGLETPDERLYLEELTLMEAFQAFAEAVSVIMTPEEADLLEEAQKK